MSKFSRRSLVVSAASLPALAMPAVAVAAAAAEPDPVFAVIKRWEEAFAAELAGFEAREAAETAFQDRYGCLFPSGMPRGVAEILERDGHEVPYWSLQTHQQIAELKSHADLGKHVPFFHRELNVQAADYEENVAPIEEASNQASSARIDAAYDVFDTVPTTLPGMRAKIDFALSADHVTGLLNDEDEILGNFLDTLYESARLIAQA